MEMALYAVGSYDDRYPIEERRNRWLYILSDAMVVPKCTFVLYAAPTPISTTITATRVVII